MHSGDPSASPAGDSVAIAPGAGNNIKSKKIHLVRGEGPGSASNAESTDTNLDLQSGDMASTMDTLSENSQGGDSAAVGSEEIGELLEGGLGDSERIDAELAELSAELGILAGLADSDRLHDLFDVAPEQRPSESSRSSSSTSSGSRGGGARAHARPARPTRRRTIAKMKEVMRECAMSSTSTCFARHDASIFRLVCPGEILDNSDVKQKMLASCRVKQAEVDDIAHCTTGLRRRAVMLGASARYLAEPGGWRAADAATDDSDVGADSDSDEEWWTECSSESSSVKEAAAAGADLHCSSGDRPQDAEPPPLGSFLLPLIGPTEAPPPPADHFLIRHEDILQLLASAEESARAEAAGEVAPAPPADEISPPTWCRAEGAPAEPSVAADVTPEEEAAVLRYVCEAERQLRESAAPALAAVESWLLRVYDLWCEISALMYTMLGAASAGIDYENWVYRAHFTCHCRLCVCRASGCAWLAAHVHRVLVSLARGENTMCDALRLMRALNLQQPGAPLQPHTWELAALQQFTTQGAEHVRRCVESLGEESDLTRELMRTGCLCRPRAQQQPSGMEGFIEVLERFKASYYTSFRVEMLRCDGGTDELLEAAARRLALHLQPYQRSSVSARLADLTANVQLQPGHRGDFQCECQQPRSLCPQQRKQLLRLSFYSLKQVVGELTGPRVCPESADDKPPCEGDLAGTSREQLQEAEICPKPPDAVSSVEPSSACEGLKSAEDALADAVDEWEPPPPLGSASQLLLAAAAAVDPGELRRTVHQLMSSIASVEVLMDRVLRHWRRAPASADADPQHCSAQLELMEVDRKLMAMYRRLPEVHQKQLQVYHKQKKLSTVCTQLVGGRAPPPPPPGSPPPLASPPRAASPQRRAAVCPEYHLRRFKEVKRKVLHMRDQQLYYQRLRLWLEEQLRRDVSAPAAGGGGVGEAGGGEEAALRRRVRRAPSPRVRKTTAAKRKLRPHASPCGPYKILQLLKCKSALPAVPAGAAEGATNSQGDATSDADTVVDKGEELCPEMKECVERFAGFALDAPDAKPSAQPPPTDFGISSATLSLYPDSLSPPLQELSPTSAEPLPVYRASHRPSRRLVAVNKLLNRSAYMLDRLKEDICAGFDKNAVDPIDCTGHPGRPSALAEKAKSPEPGNALVDVKDSTEEKPKEKAVESPAEQVAVADSSLPMEEDCEATAQSLLEQFGDFKLTPAETAAVKDPRVHRYVTFGLEIKRAIEECKNIIKSCNTRIRKNENGEVAQLPEQLPELLLNSHVQSKDEGLLSVEQIYEAIMSLEKNSPEILECMDRSADNASEPIEINMANSKLEELVENMPQILANMPEIASKLSEFTNFQFELPEFATIINNLPEVNNEAQLTPETLKQIRELKISKARDSVKVTKHTSKRKSSRRSRNNVDNDIIGTITFDIDQEMHDLIREEKEARNRNKNCSKEDGKDLLFSVSAQVVTDKVQEYVRQSMNPDLANCIEDEFKIMDDVLMIDGPKSEMCSKASTLYNDSVKDALSMEELRGMFESRLNSWKYFVSSKFKNIPMRLLEEEIESMLSKFYGYIEDLAEKQNQGDSDKIPEKLDAESKSETKEDAPKPNDANSTDNTYVLDCPNLLHNDKSNPCDCLEKEKPSEIESLKQIMKFIKDSVGSTFDIIIMQTSKMSKEHKNSVKNLKFKYMDVIRRCAESGELASWILLDPEVAANVILEMTGLAPKKTGESPNFSHCTNEKKLEYFMNQLRVMNKIYMTSLPKSSFTGDDWLVVLYRLEQLEAKLQCALAKAMRSSTKPAQTQTQSHASETREAELVAGKGLSKIINQANRSKKPISNSTNSSTEASPKTDCPPNVPPKPPAIPEKRRQVKENSHGFPVNKEVTRINNGDISSIEQPKDDVVVCEETETERRPMERNDALLAKCEAILMSHGEQSLIDSFHMIKSCITSGLPVPESYKKRVMKICSNIDAHRIDVETVVAPLKGKTLVADAKPPQPQPAQTQPEKPKVNVSPTDAIAKPTEPCSKPTDTSAKIDKSTKAPERCSKRVMKCCDNSDEVDSGSSSPRNCCPSTKGGKHFAIIGSQNPEMLAKYSAQALRNAKQSLNAVAFNSIRANGTKPNETSDTNAPRSDCKWTNDCVCTSCSDVASVICLGDIVKQCVASTAEKKAKGNPEGSKPAAAARPPPGLKDARAPVSAQPKGQPAKPPAKPAPPKICENVHLCKMGHTQAASSGCANEANHHQNGATGVEQPCNCCYCTVFGHAPPMTTPVPRNFNETRERLRSILNRKKQKGKTASAVSMDQECQESKKAVAAPVATPVEVPAAAKKDLPAVAKKEPSAAAKKELPAASKKEPPTAAKKELPVAAKKEPPTASKKELPAAAKKDPPVAAKKEPPAAAKEPPAAGHGYLAEQMAKMMLTPEAADVRPELPAAAPPKQAAALAAAKAEPTAEQRLPRSSSFPPHLLSQEDQVLRQELLQQYQQLRHKQKAALHKPPAAERQSRPHRPHSASSRDTSVFSSSSGCSAVSTWRDDCVSDEGLGRVEDTRDLDALLQYIEGPARHVDRGKKRAKKQRQKAKKMESQLRELQAELSGLAALQRRLVESLRGEQAAARRSLDESRAAVKQAQQVKRKGKKAKVCPSQAGKVQLAAERHGACNVLFTQTTQALREAERNLAEVESRLADCEEELRDARALQAARPGGGDAAAQLYPEGAGGDADAVRMRRSPGDGAMAASLAPRQEAMRALATLMHNGSKLTGMNSALLAHEVREAFKNQTLEAALAHINNSLAAPAAPPAPPAARAKDKAKKAAAKEASKAEPKTIDKQSIESSRSHSLTDQPLSKKQRKLLAKQQAEDEEARRRQQEAAGKKAESAGKKAEAAGKKAEAAGKKAEAAGKKTEAAGKKTEATGKKNEPAVKKNEPMGKKAEVAGKKIEAAWKEPTGKKAEAGKQEGKKAADKGEKGKGKENKALNNAPSGKQQKPAPAPQPQPKKGDKGKAHAQLINITPDTTIQLLSGKGGCGADESPSACSIMEQLSCGVQVADLRLPPGITLTRVAHAPPPAPVISSVPLWKCNTLASAPTPPQRPQPIINADPSLHTHSILEPPRQAVPEPQQPAGKSKKAKKKAKKAAAAAAAQPKAQPAGPGDYKKTDGTKMVTLRNPMFHPNLPPVQVSSQAPSKKLPEQIRIPDPIPMPPNSCQATITPTSNGMYTIRNPLMSMVHQQSMMGMGSQSPNPNPHLAPQSAPSYPSAYVVNQSQFNAMPPPAQRGPYAAEATSPQPERQPPAECRRGERPGRGPAARVLNLASFTQSNDEGYSLFEPSHEGGRAEPPRCAYGDAPPYAHAQLGSPSPIGTRPEHARLPEPIGPPRRDEERAEYAGLYTPFGRAEERDFRSALFGAEGGGGGAGTVPNGDSLPYFQRLRVGARLNNEVTIHHVTESKFFKTGGEPPAPLEPPELSSSVFGARPPYAPEPWAASPSSSPMGAALEAQYARRGSPQPPAAPAGDCDEAGGFGAIGRGAPIGSQRVMNGLRGPNSFYPV